MSANRLLAILQLFAILNCVLNRVPKRNFQKIKKTACRLYKVARRIMGCCISRIPTLKIEQDNEGPKPTMNISLAKRDAQAKDSNPKDGKRVAGENTLGGEVTVDERLDPKEAARLAALARAEAHNKKNKGTLAEKVVAQKSMSDEEVLKQQSYKNRRGREIDGMTEARNGV
ncbi:hypothetical protein BDV96DRAFT_641437 [Lophiotrema nucula]|uniref:Casein kinase substrate phospho protein PP28-domain-containing protein n=1 Tax=Lophiotrema nucula TaxID=690887 RepID=A0A6A5ZMF5_9PLEO|nr:hypothetical protein BDV96DRAFT_641437 [Lophiotrema nucula]